MARKKRRGTGGSGRAGRGRGPRRGTRAGGAIATAVDGFRSVLTAAILLAAGALIGSWWIEWRKAGGPQVMESPAAEPLPRLKLEVLNGTGEPGAARSVGELLIALGYDVVAFENADHFDYRVTHVIDRAGRGEHIAEVAELLGTDSVAMAIDPDLHLDATVILGADWRELVPER